MRSLWWLAVAVTACGDVNRVPDASVPDAYTPDSPNDPMCAAGEMVCSGSCANLMTSEQHCGSCTTTCAPNHGCASGTCVPANTSCARVREIDPEAPDAVYTNPNNGNKFYCDFTNNRTFDGLYMGQYDATPAGYTLVTFEQLSDPQFQALFINLYNRQAGMPLIASWVSANCCYSTTGGMDWHFGGAILYPSTGTGFSCSPPTPGYAGGPWRVYLNSNASVMTAPLAENFFVLNPVTQVAQCSEGANPGFFWRVKNSLN